MTLTIVSQSAWRVQCSVSIALLAARDAVAPHVIGLEVRGGDGQHVAFPHSGRKSLPCVRRVIAGMRPSIHIDRPFTVPCEKVHVERDQPLRRCIDFSPDAHVAEAAQRIVRCMRTALVFLNHRDAIARPSYRLAGARRH